MVSIALPLVALANPANGNSSIKDFLEGTLTDIINTTIRFLLAVATLIFVGSVVYYISLGGDSEKLADAKRFIIFAIIGLVLIIVVWGLVNIVIDSLNINKTPPPPLQF